MAISGCGYSPGTRKIKQEFQIIKTCLEKQLYEIETQLRRGHPPDDATVSEFRGEYQRRDQTSKKRAPANWFWHL